MHWLAVTSTILAMVAACSQPSAALTVTLIEWDPVGTPYATKLESLALDGGQETLVLEPVSIPFRESHRAEDRYSAAETEYVLENSKLEIRIVEHVKSYLGGAAHSRGAVYFMVDEDVRYSIDGEYLFADGQANEIRLEAILWDLDAGVRLFDNEQISYGSNATFRLGEEEGNRENRLSGSLTGVLTA